MSLARCVDQTKSIIAAKWEVGVGEWDHIRTKSKQNKTNTLHYSL